MKLKKYSAKHASKLLAVVAFAFAVAGKIPLGDKEVPASLRK